MVYFHNTCWHRPSPDCLSVCFNVIRPKELQLLVGYHCPLSFHSQVSHTVKHCTVIVMSLRLILTWFPLSGVAICNIHCPQKDSICIHRAFLLDFFFFLFFTFVFPEIGKTEFCVSRSLSWVLVLDLKVRCRGKFWAICHVNCSMFYSSRGRALKRATCGLVKIQRGYVRRPDAVMIFVNCLEASLRRYGNPLVFITPQQSRRTPVRLRLSVEGLLFKVIKCKRNSSVIRL